MMSILNVLVVCTIAVTTCLSATTNDKMWIKYKVNFEKEYVSSEHEDQHREHFENNLADIAVHNMAYDFGVHSYKMAPHNFSDHPHDVALANLCGTKVPSNFSSRASRMFAASSRANLPISVDWRTERVTPVKNQGSCGSCWSFAAAGAIEGQLIANGYKLTDLSEQQLVDCSTDNNGCNGGWPDTAFEYVIENGISKLTDYPYTAKEGTCNSDSSKAFVQLDDYFNVKSGDEDACAEALAKNGPLSVAIHVTEKFMNYKSGIYTEANCPTQVNHGVLLVGYGSENGKKYWIVKNSWGPGWGEKGYIRMAKNAGNLCKICSYASWPNVVKS